jgi:hypothetical protein
MVPKVVDGLRRSNGQDGISGAAIFGLRVTHVGYLVNPIKNDAIPGLVGRIG